LRFSSRGRHRRRLAAGARISSVLMDDVAAAPSGAQAAREPGPLRLGRAEFPPERRLVMAIVIRGDLPPARAVRGLA
jgi:hypothetical protein